MLKRFEHAACAAYWNQQHLTASWCYVRPVFRPYAMNGHLFKYRQLVTMSKRVLLVNAAITSHH